ncbi:hypothetical protein [Bacillus phage PK16]|nr:hypothetical protein [Bacillus phage PK16]AUM59002.1 hypothetical protein BCP01_201 [Bacillus phage BCP01]
MSNEPKVQKFDETYLRIAITHMERFQPKTLRDEHHKEAFLFSMREMLTLMEAGLLLGYQEHSTKIQKAIVEAKVYEELAKDYEIVVRPKRYYAPGSNYYN